ncbi:hypothetical protein NXX42_00190 [Bacteroides thetaiotaomicron]|nr:hypothetical protein [Bacteroides thetaiotaomicron]
MRSDSKLCQHLFGNWGTMYEYAPFNEGLNKLKKYASFGQTEQDGWKRKCAPSEVFIPTW